MSQSEEAGSSQEKRGVPAHDVHYEIQVPGLSVHFHCHHDGRPGGESPVLAGPIAESNGEFDFTYRLKTAGRHLNFSFKSEAVGEVVNRIVDANEGGGGNTKSGLGF